MATFEMLYLRDVDEDRVATAFSQCFPDASATMARMEGHRWLQVRDVEWTQLPVVAAALSSQLGCRAIAFAVQTSVDALEIWDLHRGDCVRHLVFEGGGDRWTLVEGQRQDWEDALFTDRVAVDLAELEEDGDDPDGLNRRVLETRTPAMGARLPYVGTSEHLAIAEAIGLPGFMNRGGWGPERGIGKQLPRLGVPLVVGGFFACLLADLFLLPPASWFSTLVFAAQIGLFLLLLRRALGRPLL